MSDQPTEERHTVVNESDRQRLFKCGHTGSVHWDFSHFGTVYELNPQATANSNNCPACSLREMSDGMGQCSRCGDIIPKGSSCVMLPEGIGCLNVTCNQGPMAHNPGIWDGKKFVPGLEAGTMKILASRTRKF